MVDSYRVLAEREWGKARRKAMWSNILNTMRPTSNELISFYNVADRLRLKNSQYIGHQNIPLEKIVGSVGRYQDFTRAFLPTERITEDRWKGIASAYLNGTGRGVPAIEVFKVGDSYFVKDGNHRVSVARQLGLADIDAAIWEYSLSIPDAENVDIDTLLIKAERQDFMRETELDKLRPQNKFEVTVPGGYTDLLCQIAHYQDVLSQIDETEISYEDAVTAWHDMIYETTLQKIRNEGVLELFPKRTETDFFIWVTRHHRELKARYDRPVMVSQVVRNFREQNRPKFVTYLRRFIRRLFGRRPDEPL